MRLEGLVTLVTGGASGIGRATAKLFAQEGAKVAVVDVQKSQGTETVQAINGAGGQATFIEADVSIVSECEQMVAKAVDKYGGLNVLINNAGINLVATTEETSEADWDRVVAVNQKGVFFGSKAAVPYMIRAGGGSIISMASVQTFQGMPNFIAYSGTKGAIYSMTIAMAKDLARYNIRVNCICPGAVDTPINDRLFAEQPDPDSARRGAAKMAALKRMGDPIEVAHAAVYLAGNESTWVTGVALPVDGGFLTNPKRP